MNEYLYELDYENLKRKLLSLDELTLKEILKDYKIKEKIINSPTQYDFIWFAQERNDNIFTSLLDDVGIELLSQSSDLIDKLNGILTSENNYVTDIFKNENFLKLLIDNFDDLSHYMYAIDENAAIMILDYTKNDKILQKRIIESLGKITTEKLVKIYKIDNDILMDILITSPDKAADYLLRNDLRITSLNNLTFFQLYNLFKKDVHIPNELLEEQTLINKLITIYDPKDYRFLIEELRNNNDVEVIETKRKQYYENEIKSFNAEHNMMNRYYNAYLELVKLSENKQFSSNDLLVIIDKYFNFFANENAKYSFIMKISTIIHDKKMLKAYLQEESNYAITNMIIDYHFEDVYYNFLLNLKQLYNFQQTEGRTLNNEDLEIYKSLLRLDTLSYDEKIVLFEKLKNSNYVEKFYDDYRNAKNKALSMIKEQMLNFDNIHKYRNAEISEQLGVDVYVLNGNPFYAFVKSLGFHKSEILPAQLKSYVDGSSYSLDGSDKLNTFSNPKDYYNIMYGDFNINQVVHTYSVDSFSRYSRNNTSSATRRVYELYTPNEFVNKSSHYNEIVYSQRNMKKNDELNNSLDIPKMISIYCYDEITENDIISAKKLGIGITLVKTKNYHIEHDNKISMYDTILTNLENDINYLNNIRQDAMYGRRK